MQDNIDFIDDMYNCSSPFLITGLLKETIAYSYMFNLINNFPSTAKRLFGIP